MERDGKRRWALILVLAIVMGFLPTGQAQAEEENDPADTQADYGLSNPTTSEGVTTWDCVWFGNYWQEDTNGDGVADQTDDKTPVKWRVLSVDGDDAFLLADKSLDCQPYNTTFADVTWETCTMRSWLNGYGANQNHDAVDYSSDSFLDHVFTLSEQSAIKDTKVVNENNPQYGTEGGNDTTDKVYLLSISEVSETKYGFASDCDKNDAGRRAKNTAYAKAQGAYTISRNGFWWLRSPGFSISSNSSYTASNVYNNGYVTQDGYNVCDLIYAVHPVLHLDLASTSVWSKAGTVSSLGDVNETPFFTPTPSPVVTPAPTASQGSSATLTPATSTPLIPPSSLPSMYKMTVTIKGNGVTTVRTNQGYVSTEQMAELTVEGNGEVILVFIPEEGHSFVSLTVDGQKQECDGETYTIPHIGKGHDIVVEFTEKMPLPTQDPPHTEKPALVSTLHPTAFQTSVPTQIPSPDENLSVIVDGLGVPEDIAVKIQMAAEELDVSMDTLLVTEQMIQSQKTDDDIKGAYFSRIQARASQITQKNIKLSWNRVNGADGYEIYGNRCNTKKWIYKYKKMKTIEKGNKKSFIDQNCKKGMYYKYIVRAYKIIDGKKVTIAASKTIHVTTAGGKNGNAKSVKVNKKKVSLKAGKDIKLKAREIKEFKPLRHHREVSYESSNPDVATISKKGRIKAKKKGKCMVFAYAQSGVYKTVKVTVK